MPEDICSALCICHICVSCTLFYKNSIYFVHVNDCINNQLLSSITTSIIKVSLYFVFGLLHSIISIRNTLKLLCKINEDNVPLYQQRLRKPCILTSYRKSTPYTTSRKWQDTKVSPRCIYYTYCSVQKRHWSSCSGT